MTWKVKRKKKRSIPIKRSFGAQFDNGIKHDEAKNLAESITNETKNICFYFLNENDASNIFFIIVPSMKKGNYSFTRVWNEYEKTIAKLCRNMNKTFKQLVLLIKSYSNKKENTVNLELINQFESLHLNKSLGVDEDDEVLFYDSATSEDDNSDIDVDDGEERVMLYRKKNQQHYSSLCDFNFCCQMGSNCKNVHQEEEKEFF